MLLKIGELAKLMGLTTRTLHHYDEIDLLKPSFRSENGYRLYNGEDVSHLRKIYLLRNLGFSLEQIRSVITQQDVDLSSVIKEQIESTNFELKKQQLLQSRLLILHEKLRENKVVDADDWQETLELLSVYEKHFHGADITCFPFVNPKKKYEWVQMSTEVKKLYSSNIPPSNAEARSLAINWMEMLERDTDCNPEWLLSFATINDKDPFFIQQLGLDNEVISFLLESFSESKLYIFSKYLTDHEMSFMRKHYVFEMKKWPQLLFDLHSAIFNDVCPDSKEGLALAKRWIDIFEGYAGKNPATHRKIRYAIKNDPILRKGTWLRPMHLVFLEKAVSALNFSKD